MNERNSPAAIKKRTLSDIRHGRHCVFKNFAHLVFVTKYRRDVITDPILRRMEELLRETCSQMDCELIEFNGEHDHVHMMVSIHPKIAVSNLVGKLKGKTAYFIKQEFTKDIKKKLWGDHFWSPSYCVVSCDGAPLEIIKQYIENQRRPQA
ncbi:MAG: IS200/IS605 family transposase [Bdellovibrionia bacterium]